MKINQVATLLTSINNEMLGETAITAVNEDLSNIVDVGRQLTEQSTDLEGFFENYAKKLVDKVGRVVVVDRSYRSTAPNIQKDSWEYGSIMEKIRVSVNELEDDTTWTLNRGDTPEQFEYQPATISAKYFDSYDTFMTMISLTTKTIKSAFKSASEMNKLISAIENRVRMKLAISADNLKRRTVNNLIAEKIKAGKDINLLAMYNAAAGTSLTLAAAIVNPTFLKYAVAQIMRYKKMLENPSVLFGDDGYVNFTPESKQRMILLDQFKQNTEVYMESDTFHNELVSLGNKFQSVPYWQGSGTDTTFPIGTISGINVKTASDGTVVQTSGVIGILFDDDACGVCLEEQETTSAYAANGRFVNYFHYVGARYFNDLAENVLVFTMRPASSQNSTNAINDGNRSMKSVNVNTTWDATGTKVINLDKQTETETVKTTK